MKRFAAQYVFPNSGPPLKRALITTQDDGTIISVEDTKGYLKEEHSTEYYNGIIIPGFVNSHCHLELSHMKGFIPEKTSLGGFLEHIRNSREIAKENITSRAFAADNYMYDQGIVLCADICNTVDTFGIKQESRIRYYNLLEVFGIDPEKAGKRMDEITMVSEVALNMHLPISLVPHSAYSMSLTLMRLLKNECMNNSLTSIHFMETSGEKSLLKDHSGPLMESYQRMGILPASLETAASHEDVVLKEITQSGNLILVHGTFADRETIRSVKARNNLFWCICPNSNIYIENKLPPVSLLEEEDCEIVVGTDSLASNQKLSILEELKTIQSNFPDITLGKLILWATQNGARALGEEKQYGTIEPGKKPGLLVLENVDLQNMKLLPESYVTRLI
jgi:cytosine/adenosine deaminase-related metal-dependent hydrolase